MEGVLILAHGSRRDETEETMSKISQMVCERLPQTLIETAYLQFRKTDLAAGLDRLIEKGADSITVIPYFLFEGIHIREDIPAEIDSFIKSHNGITVRMGKNLGVDSRLADILADRIRQVL